MELLSVVCSLLLIEEYVVHHSLSWTILSFVILSYGIFSRKALKRPKLALLKFRFVTFISSLLLPLRILNSVI